MGKTTKTKGEPEKRPIAPKTDAEWLGFLEEVHWPNERRSSTCALALAGGAVVRLHKDGTWEHLKEPR